MPEMKVAVGSLIAIPNSIRSGHMLGLVVDREAGERWVSRDPFPDTRAQATPSSVLVRLLGRHTTDLYYSGNEQLWGEEPSRFATVRWLYVETNPNPPWVVAGPDTFSIEKFFSACKTCETLGMTGATFLHELQILLDHLKGHVKSVDNTSIFERRYRVMLDDVLPPQH